MFKKTIILSSILFSTTFVNAADIANSNLQVNFESAHLQGAGNQITMLKVPVTNKETGVTQFFDMSAVFAADTNGDLVFKNISSVKSVAFGSANQLVAGHYLDGKNQSWYVAGPSVGANGRLSWTLAESTGSYQTDVQLLSGPLANNELVFHLGAYKKLLKTSKELNYGIVNGDYLISGSQSGNMISLTSYDKHGAPKESWSLRQAPEPKVEE
ncbi:hypothetical protein MT391_11980 [Vibrio sp. 1-Bac 57]